LAGVLGLDDRELIVLRVGVVKGLLYFWGGFLMGRIERDTVG